jgi:signal transduction histidine kinase
MQNTKRLAKREPLVPALAGHDEIALLDRVLVDTGNHLIELETFKRELVSIVSHELRTPLLSISSALELFGAGLFGELSEKGKSRLTYAQAEAGRLIRLITDLLDIEKMDAGKFVLDFSEVKVSDLLDSSTTGAAQLAEVKKIIIETKCQESDGIIHVDRDRFCQVFINLLSNAIKYSPENGKIIVSTQKLDGDRIKFSIIDQGRGIPEDLRLRIFDRFVQVEKSDATERGGTGLGLAICKAIVEQHGGEIGVDSKIGSGSTFWFVVPARSVTALAAQ